MNWTMRLTNGLVVRLSTRITKSGEIELDGYEVEEESGHTADLTNSDAYQVETEINRWIDINISKILAAHDWYEEIDFKRLNSAQIKALNKGE